MCPEKRNSRNSNTLGGEKNLTQLVYEKIKEMMLGYEIIPGQRLIFIDLARRLGVSRTPVNHALSILSNEGFLDFVPNQGYRVHQITEKEAESLYEIREIIELGSIGKAIETIQQRQSVNVHQDAIQTGLFSELHLARYQGIHRRD